MALEGTKNAEKFHYVKLFDTFVKYISHFA